MKPLLKATNDAEGGSTMSTTHQLTAPRARWKRAGDALSRRLWFLDPGELRREAQRRTGLEDFGDPPLEPALSVLVGSLESEADLHPLGRYLVRTHLLDLLETRLRLVKLWQDHPQSGEGMPLRQPLFIIGMPRSGSTFLHELLAQDPRNRAPRVWEVMFPLPAPDKPDQGRRARVRKAAACLWCFRRLAPGADSVYPMRAVTPHECVAIHSYTFLSQEFISTCRIPSYERFLLGADLAPVYRWQRRFLQHLQRAEPGGRWVLKSPDHVYGLAQLFAVFPDARVLHTHRNPLEVLRSSAELTRVLHGLYAWPGDLAEARSREARVLAEGTERSIQFRDQHPELAGRFIDVTYSELASQPLAVVERIYHQLGLRLCDVAAHRMEALASSRTRYRPRRTAANTAWLWTDLAGEAGRFDRYCSRFGLSCRPVGVRR